MKNSIKIYRPFILFILVAAIIALSVSNVSAQSLDITLDHVVGRLGSTDTIFCDQPIEFHMRTKNNFNIAVGEGGAGAVFKIYSPDGAVWMPITMDTAGLMGTGWGDMFDGLIMLDVYGANGTGSDTGCFWAFSVFASGLTADFDAVSWIIRTQLDCSQSGKTICIDSVTNGDNNCDWLWTGPGPGGAIFPTWDGPHCFTISIAGCCTGVRGNVNGQGGDNPNILDLSWIVSYIFRSNNDPGPCPEESDINGDGGIANVLDLTFLVDYIFRGGPLPGPCP